MLWQTLDTLTNAQVCAKKLCWNRMCQPLTLRDHCLKDWFTPMLNAHTCWKINGFPAKPLIYLFMKITFTRLKHFVPAFSVNWYISVCDWWTLNVTLSTVVTEQMGTIHQRHYLYGKWVHIIYQEFSHQVILKHSLFYLLDNVTFNRKWQLQNNNFELSSITWRFFLIIHGFKGWKW